MIQNFYLSPKLMAARSSSIFRQHFAFVLLFSSSPCPSTGKRPFVFLQSLPALLWGGTCGTTTSHSKRGTHTSPSLRLVSSPLVPLPCLTTPSGSPEEARSTACPPSTRPFCCRKGGGEVSNPNGVFPQAGKNRVRRRTCFILMQIQLQQIYD